VPELLEDVPVFPPSSLLDDPHARRIPAVSERVDATSTAALESECIT
jgi:hypothetical protein